MPRDAALSAGSTDVAYTSVKAAPTGAQSRALMSIHPAQKDRSRSASAHWWLGRRSASTPAIRLTIAVTIQIAVMAALIARVPSVDGRRLERLISYPVTLASRGAGPGVVLSNAVNSGRGRVEPAW